MLKLTQINIETTKIVKGKILINKFSATSFNLIFPLNEKLTSRPTNKSPDNIPMCSLLDKIKAITKYISSEEIVSFFPKKDLYSKRLNSY
jgi:hypothetical protein